MEHYVKINTVASYNCSCRPGFLGDGRLCHDVDECEDGTEKCDANAQCTNSLGSYESTYNSGFSGNDQVCQDVDECLNSFGDCSYTATCNNKEGSYTCSYNEDFHGNGRLCFDNDECSAGTHLCSDHAECLNNQGGTPRSTFWVTKGGPLLFFFDILLSAFKYGNRCFTKYPADMPDDFKQTFSAGMSY
ncbi:hypothetical protein pdam_00015351 [Pocillopora damicornis]|uniref:EGF-like domain-containing protein n=1 Tax=Pocillopora damicornis TaxID=46731 RepID=A0A3M6V1L3_POCDA|nr:hypothetical protein pdam_00015351 [Pocillopora damicornis]